MGALTQKHPIRFFKGIFKWGDEVGTSKVSREIIEGDFDNITGLFRREKNLGAFSKLEVNMDLRTVKYYAEQGGVGLKGIKIRIVRDEELLGRNVFGYTHPKGNIIELYPDAFTDVETLIRTLGHERTHVYQIKTLGLPKGSETLSLYEKAAMQSELPFYQYFQKYGKLK